VIEMKLTGTQITGLVIAALAVIGVVLLATLADGEHVDKLLIFLGGLVLPSPLSFGGGGGGGGTRRAASQAAAALVVIALGGLLVGCGGSTVARYATATTTAIVAVDAAGGLVKDVAKAELDACTDEACVTQVQEHYRPVTLAIDSVQAAARALADVIEVAALGTSDVAGALELAARRVFDRLDDALAILRREVEVPPWLDTALAGARVALVALVGLVMDGAT
jgi:hypothetical protein